MSVVDDDQGLEPGALDDLTADDLLAALDELLGDELDEWDEFGDTGAP